MSTPKGDETSTKENNMEYKEFKPIIIAIIAMIAMLGALCIATPAMAEGEGLPEVSDQIMINTSAKDIQDFDMIEIDPDPLAYNESLNNSSADLEACDSAISGEIVGVTITPTRLVSNQYVTYTVSVKNTGDHGDTETFSWIRTMGSPGDREYTFELYWDRVWYEGGNVLLDTVIVDRYCFAAGLPDIYEPDDDSSYATDIDTNGEAQYHDFHDSGDGDWVTFFVELGDVCTIGSKITHTCARSGYQYAKVRQYSSDVYGETTSYSISVSHIRGHSPFAIGGHVYLDTATVSGADVTVTNLNTIESLTTTTDSNGVYVVNLCNLPGGHSTGDTIQVTATYYGMTGTNSAPRSESLGDTLQIIDVTIAQAVQIRAEAGGDLPPSIPVGETFTVLITEDGSPVGAGTSVVFQIPHDTGDPVCLSTDDDGKVTYEPLIEGTLGIRVLDGTGTLVAIAMMTVGAPSGPIVSISDGNADTGATTTVTITADNVTDLANFDITVTYDSAVVKVTVAENNAAFGSSMNNLDGASTGTVRLTSLNTGTTGQTGDGVLLSTLTLEALGTAAQTSALTLTVNSLMDSSEGDITATVDNGVFTVSEVPSGPVVTISDGSADTGATTTVTVTADAVTDLANFDITVTYDPAVVKVTAAENNAAFGSSINNLEGASTGTVGLMSLNIGSGQTGDGVLLSTLTLEALGTAAQTSALTLTINSLMDPSDGRCNISGKACGWNVRI
jgi:hypothetical protein